MISPTSSGLEVLGSPPTPREVLTMARRLRAVLEGRHTYHNTNVGDAAKAALRDPLGIVGTRDRAQAFVAMCARYGVIR